MDEAISKISIKNVDKLVQISGGVGHDLIINTAAGMPQKPDTVEHYLEFFEKDLPKAILTPKTDFNLTYRDGDNPKAIEFTGPLLSPGSLNSFSPVYVAAPFV